MQVANSPLFIEDLSINNNEIKRGSTIRRRVIVKNLGDKRAEVDIWIEATNQKSEPLLRWYDFSEKPPLKLDPKQSIEVALYIEVPSQAAPDLYNYEILVEARAQYPDKLIRRPQQLRVLPSEQDADWGTDPGFTLQPVTNSANPYPLHAGEQLEVKVQVENRSKRVDRFYLTCPELNNDWFTVRYPESSLEIAGLVKEMDGLELNPNGTGEIVLLLHPPQYTPTGNYFPTIRLLSSNKEELVLLDVVYLQILPDDALNVQLHPVLRQVPDELGEFEVELTNQGNIRREIAILASDREKLFTYTPEPPLVPILPGDTQHVTLKVKSQKWWRRPFWGKGLEFKFDIELTNTIVETARVLPLLPEHAAPPALPKDLPQGTLVWKPRPWWLLWLLMLLALGTVGAIAFIIWWQFFKPPASPKIIKFDTTKKVYEESKGESISLNWYISNLSELKQVTVIRRERNQETERNSYDFSQGIPNELKRKISNQKNNFCKPITERNIKGVSCTGIITNTRKSGDYTFQLQVVPKPSQKLFSKSIQNKFSDSQETDTVKINPVISQPLPPLPKIIDLSSTKAIYEEVSIGSLQLSNSSTRTTAPNLSSDRPMVAPILLNWEVSSPSKLKELRIISVAPDNSINSELKRYEIRNNLLPPELSRFCEPKGKLDLKKNLICRNVPTDARKAGDYTFKLTVVPKQGEQPSDLKQTNTIKVLPLPLPNITDFSSTKPTYEEVGAKPLQPSKGQNISTNSSTPTTTAGLPSSRSIPTPIRLNWEITNPNQVKELKIISLASDGSINSELKRYPFFTNTLPSDLRKFCYVAQSLVCRNVPTDAQQPGDYTFTLTVVPKQGLEEPEIAKKTATIKIKPQPPQPLSFPPPPPPPPPPNIVYFKVNNQEVRQKPKYVFPINKERSTVDVVLSWQVEEEEGIKVELLPAPGAVPSKGSITYSLSKPPSSETITLRVKNQAGEEKTQSVVIETSEVNRSNQPTTSPSRAASPGAASPSPSNSDKLSPIELPPSPD